MKNILAAILLALSSAPAFATLAATAAWDVRTTGSDSNAGCFDSGVASPGTNYSVQDAAQVSYTDLVIGATNTQLTSAGNPFTSASVGNCINVTAGTGFTTGRYEVLSVSGSTATMDRAVGTASSTGGVGVLGGCLLTISTATSAAVTSNSIHIKAGTYTLTSGISTALTTISWIGYQSTHNDGGTKPLITTATNSVDLFTTTGCSGVQVWKNLSLSNTATTRGNGVLQTSCHSSGAWALVNDVLDGFATAVDSDNAGAHFDLGTAYVVGTEIKNSTAYALNGVVTSLHVVGSYVHNNVNGMVGGNLSVLVVKDSIFSVNGGGRAIDFGGNSIILIAGTAFYGNTGSYACSCTSGGAASITYYNNIFYGNTGTAINFTAGTAQITIFQAVNQANAFGANGSTGWVAGTPLITLTANPFTNAASGDFSLNNTAGGGALLRNLGFPTQYGTTTTSNLSVGVAQLSGGGGSVSGNYGVSN